MSKNKRNLILAFLALVIAIALIVITFGFRKNLGWWAFADAFALFMTIFTWMMSIIVGKIIPHSGRVLTRFTIIFAILFVIALIAEYVVYLVLVS
ncbi:MAG: hypothetical protein K2K93_00230 [Muribaculaceae bacterium]|nr:hypothetical protein [Muribaculaceae bacterium]